MERLKHMGLKKAYFLLSLTALAAALFLAVGVKLWCNKISERYPRGGVTFSAEGILTELPGPTLEQARMLGLLDGIWMAAAVLFPAAGLAVAGILFYHLKLKTPIAVLKAGMERIGNRDLDFSIPEVSGDELGQICAAFEMMRSELKKANQELWRQAEERKRLNAAFSHDLRNPVTVLKGSIRLLQQGRGDEKILARMETYTLRIERYIEVMSGIQRLEQIPVRTGSVELSVLQEELGETLDLLAPGLDTRLLVPEIGSVEIDHGIFLTVAENLMGNAARFARETLELCLSLEEGHLVFTLWDDGPGFPAPLLKDGPKPFGKMEEQGEHFGMGLYSSHLLCLKHGGALCLENRPEGGAAVTASFQIKKKA